jgi:outer membrane protein assembly factor BamD (BamD/ComL family)
MEKKMKHKDVIKLVKRNETQEFMTGATDYFKKNTENIIIGAVIVVVVVIAIPLYMNSRATAEVKAEQSLSEANYYVNRPILDDPQAAQYGLFRTNKDKYEKVEAAYNNVLQNFKGTKAYAQAMLGLADAYFNNGQYKEAIEYYSSFVEKYPKHPQAADAASGKAYALYQQGQYADAAKQWELVLKDYNGGTAINDVKLKLASCYAMLKDNAKAKALCGDIIKDSKEGYWVNMAKDLLSRTQ